MSSEIFLPAVVTTPQPTVSNLIAAYKSDPYSRYHVVRFPTRSNYDSLTRRLERDCGSMLLSDLADARTLTELHRGWLGADNHIAMAHSLMGMIRTLATFGATFMRSHDCREVKALLHDLKFSMTKPRKTIITAAQVIALRRQAWKAGHPSIALAHAGQFSFTFRQKDIIGEIVPASEPGSGFPMPDGRKWMRGIHWGELDRDLILRHTTSKRNKPVEIDVKLAPMFMEELRLHRDAGLLDTMILRGGPIIVNESTGLPYSAVQFRRIWRGLATAAGIPKHVYNMDSRAGAITEALRLGAPINSVRKGATHSNQSQTENYDRGDADAIALVMGIRAQAHEQMQGEG